jgi:hypothetical protein
MPQKDLCCVDDEDDDHHEVNVAAILVAIGRLAPLEWWCGECSFEATILATNGGTTTTTRTRTTFPIKASTVE